VPETGQTRTVIETGGREFELPPNHTMRVYAGQDGRESYVALTAPGGESSIFALRDALERHGDTVVVRLGRLMGHGGASGFGDPVPEPTGYPFPPD
jgi:hypothetical protein